MTLRRPDRVLRARRVVSALTVMVVAACSGGDETGGSATSSVAPSTVAPTTEALPTTTALPIGPAAYATAGPYPVGVTTLTLPTGVAVEVWYPTTAEPTGVIGYDVRDYVPPDVRALLSQDVDAGYWFPGSRDTPVADGPFPLVVFSHGYSGIRVQSSFLTGHLASWGMIVAAPEHASRDLTNVLAQTASGSDDEAVADVLQTLDLIAAEDVTAGGRFEGRVDLDHVALAGHSAGGRTILGAGLDGRVDAYVSMASGGPADGAAYPATPSLFLAGTLDGVVPVTSATRPAHDGAPSPSWFLELDATGHNGFDDFCTFGNGTGIIGLAEASGLGPALDAMPQLRTLGEDGCLPPAVDVEEAFGVIRHSAVSFLRTAFGLDPVPAIGAELDGAYPIAVTTAAH